MTDTVTYVFSSKEEYDAPIPTLDPPYPGRQQVTIEATYDGKTLPFTDLTATVSGATDDEYATNMWNAMRGRVYVTFGLPDPDQL